MSLLQGIPDVDFLSVGVDGPLPEDWKLLVDRCQIESSEKIKILN